MPAQFPERALPRPVVDPDIDGVFHLPPSRDARRDMVALSTILLAALLHLVLLALLLASWREAAPPVPQPIEVRLVQEPPKPPPPPPQPKPEPPKPKPEPEKPKPKPEAEKPKPPEPPKPAEMKPRESGPDEKTEARKSDKPKTELPAPLPITPKAEEKPPPPVPPTPAPEPKAEEIAPKPEPAPPPSPKVEDVPPPPVADLPLPPEPKPTPPPRVKARAPAIGRTAAIPLADLPPALQPQRRVEPPIRNLTIRLPSRGGGSADRDMSGDPYLNRLMRILERNRVYPPADAFSGVAGRNTAYSVLIEPSGHIVNITPLMGTGVPVIDEAAREMVSNCDPFPPVPSDFPQIRTLITILIPMFPAR